MPGRRNDINADDIVSRYLAGESLHSLSKRYGVDRDVPRRVLREHNIGPRNQAEAALLLRSQVADPVGLVDNYLAGESAKALGRRLGLAERVVTRTLCQQGVALRANTEANRLRSERMTEAEHRARTAMWADGWNTPISVPSFVPKNIVGLRRAALTRQITLSKQLPDELRVRALLPPAWGVEQLPVDRYNLDFAHGTVAVEVHSAAYHPFWFKQHASRAVDLAERGWHLAYLWLTKGHALSERGVAELVAHAERLDRDPAPERQYIVIRGCGEVISTGRLDPVERTIVPASPDSP
jgi:very-short-patch-repair endonuclease